MHTIITHAGSFHADESMAIVLLEKFYLSAPLRMTLDLPQEKVLELLSGKTWQHDPVFFPDGTEDARTGVPIVRTRDATLLAKANENPSCFVIDVGGEYNDALLNFDHHQKSMQHTWNDGTPFSSTGLIWTWLIKNNLVELPPPVRQELEEKIVKPLDMHDNGLSVSPVAAQLGAYNRMSDDPVLQDEQFAKGLILMRDTLENAIFSATLKMEARTVLTRQWNRALAQGDTVVVLQKPLAYHDCTGLLKEISKGQASVLVIPGQGNRYSVISQGLDTPFSIKCPCPKEWRGQMNKTIEINGKEIMLRFAHKTGFMCVVEGSQKDAHTVARFVAQLSVGHAPVTQAPSTNQASTMGSKQTQPKPHSTSRRPPRQEQAEQASKVEVAHKPSRPKP